MVPEEFAMITKAWQLHFVDVHRRERDLHPSLFAWRLPPGFSHYGLVYLGDVVDMNKLSHTRVCSAAAQLISFQPSGVWERSEC